MKYLVLLLMSFLLLNIQAYSQGCSDAGVCSIGSLGLAQYKYEKLPSDKVTLELMETEDTEIYTKDFDPTQSKRDTLIAVDTPPKDTLAKKIDTTEPISYNIDSLKQNSHLLKGNAFKSPKFILNYAVSYGVGDNETAVITNQLEGNYRIINKKLYAQLKLPYVHVSGNLGRTNGLGDLTLSLSYIALHKKNTQLTFVGGTKIATHASDLSNNNRSLPMIYQTSLGSNDLLLGANLRVDKWDLSLAYQHSFNANQNGYLHDALLGDDPYNTYFESNLIKRADDGVFRLNRSFLINKLTLTSGVLLIYHLQNDEYTNALGNRVVSKGSQGLTVNLNLAAITPLYKKVDFTFIVAAPVVTRDARPDGLTREYIVQGGLKYNFY